MCPLGSAAWSAPVTIESDASWGYPRLAASPTGGRAVLFTRNTTGALWVRRQSGATWVAELLTAQRAWSYDVAYAPNGVMWVAYYTPDGGHRVLVESWAGSTRTSQAIIDFPGGAVPGAQAFSGVSIAVGSTGVVHVAWLDFTRGNRLRYATNATGAFATEEVTPCDDVLGGTSIAVDSAGRPHVTFPMPAPSFTTLGYAVKQ